jgi:hypothetical protein
MQAVHPELTRAISGADNWDCFFVRWGEEKAAQLRQQPFLAGSFAYHWHNRYNIGLPNNSWAGILHDRYRALSADKVCADPAAAAAPA